MISVSVPCASSSYILVGSECDGEVMSRVSETADTISDVSAAVTGISFVVLLNSFVDICTPGSTRLAGRFSHCPRRLGRQFEHCLFAFRQVQFLQRPLPLRQQTGSIASARLKRLSKSTKRRSLYPTLYMAVKPELALMFGYIEVKCFRV